MSWYREMEKYTRIQKNCQSHISVWIINEFLTDFPKIGYLGSTWELTISFCQVILGFLVALKQFRMVTILGDQLFTGLQKNAVVVAERKPSSTSTDGNWSCNAGDSVMEWKTVKTTVKDQNSSATAPCKEPCSAVQDCDFDFKIPQPCGSCS